MLNILQEYLIVALRDRLKYLRNYRGKDGAATKREADDSTSGEAEATPCKKKKVGFLTSKPRPPALTASVLGEDKASFKIHMSSLKKEHARITPRPHVMADLMKKTFHVRRQEIMTSPTTVTNLLKAYPSLKKYDIVSD